ncbi:MAG: SDR family NAD(P)-dependent oxidoreductase [Anaerolineae bacterium]|jgi:NAD(P)-dependent dehydrogenase (short-subunit alcohol dehydrogenase family)
MIEAKRTGPSGKPLAGRVAVITGAGRGIGRALAAELRRMGACVVRADLADEAGTSGDEELFVPTDVSSLDDVENLHRRTLERFGPPDIVVNGATVSPVGSVLETEPETWDRVQAVNLRGTFLVCRAFLPQMLERGSGTIVNMVSTDAMPFLSAYIASKQGLVGFSQSLAAEVGEKGVRVIAFAPGLVDTPGLRQAARDLAPRLGTTYDDFMRMAMPAERAALAAVQLLLRYADEYHGESVDGYTILERAEAEGEAVAPVEEPEPALVDTRTRAEHLREAQRLTARLQAVVDQTGTEFGRLPVFVRPLARRGFRRKTGMDVEGWARTLADLQGHLRQMDRLEGATVAAFRAEGPELLQDLEALLTYYREAPVEYARFSRDEESNAFVAELSAERVQIIEALMVELEHIRR